MQPLFDALKSHAVIYVTRDIDRALGLSLDTPGYYIISNATPIAKEMAGNRTNILLIDADRMLDTWELLEHKMTRECIKKFPISNFQFPISILVFKNSKKIERICAQNNWQLLNPPARLAANVEEKITQLSFLTELKDLFPAYEVNELSSIHYAHPFVLQFNHSHTGEGTMFIETEEQLNALKQIFPHRDVRVTKFIDGPIFTNNNVVHTNGVLISNISYQITGLKPFTNNPFATIGNDWGVIKKLLTAEQIQQYNAIATRVGLSLKEKGWKGLFGIDVILEQTTGKLCLLEINARQPQSTTFESQLQNKCGMRNAECGMTIFEAHLAAMLDLDLNNTELIPINDGAQLVLRHPHIEPVWYRKTQSVMIDHHVFNEMGETIVKETSAD